MNAYLIVGSGAFLGGALRHGVNQIMLRLFGPGLPLGTLTVNVAGSFAMGLVVGYFAFRGEAPQSLRLFLATGVLGGFTTFSAFSLDFALLAERGQVGMALAYAAVSVMASIAAIFLGLWVMRGAG
jgi:fluoride exporter